MSGYGVYSDDFYLNMNLGTEMDLPHNRETVLHFFEQLQRSYPKMQNFYSRERSEFVLEEEKDQGAYRWASIEQRRINSGYVNPESFESAVDQHAMVLELVPFALSLSPLDCESLSVVLGFDYTFRGNQNEVMTQTFGVIPGFEKLIEESQGGVLCNEPSIQVSLDEDCRTQCRVGFETRTSAYQVRTGEFPEEQLSVYLTVRRYDSLQTGEDYASEFRRLAGLSRNLLDSYMIENILRPLQQTIALK